MKILSLKKMGMWLILATVTSAQGVSAESLFDAFHLGHSHSRHCKPAISRSERITILDRGQTDWQRIANNLNEIFLIESLTGLTPAIDPTIAALVTALNGSATAAGSIFQASADFRAILELLSVPVGTAANVEAAINAFVQAAELYSASVATGTPAEQAATFSAWQAQGVNLGFALEAAIGAAPGTTNLLNLINELIVAEVNVIQNFIPGSGVFAKAVESQAIATDVAAQISNFVLERLIDSVNHEACR